MKKIMFVMPQLFGGGAERVAAVLAGELCRSGEYEVHMVTYVRDKESEYPVEDGIIWHDMEFSDASRISRMIGKVKQFRKLFGEIEPNCVVSLAGPEVMTLLAAAAVGLRVPLVFSERNDPRNYPQSRILRILRLWAYGRSYAMVFQTREAMSFFPAGIRKKGTVISNPLTASLPDPFGGSRDTRIVTSCRLNSQKNLDLLIDAFSDIAKEYPDHRVEIYGEGAERERLSRKIVDMGLEGRVTLCGYSSHIHSDIQSAAMFVLSSDYEGISNSMLEAIALGIPTICTDCPAGGARATIADGVNGLLVPVRDRKKMADAMRRLISDPDFAGQLGKNGVALREKISVSEISRQWISVIESVSK